MDMAEKYWGNCFPTAFPENKFVERRENILYMNKLFNEVFGLCLSEINYIYDPGLTTELKKLY